MRIGRLRTRLIRLENRLLPPTGIPKSEPPRVEVSRLDDWARHYLRDYFKLPLSKFHRWLVSRLQGLHTCRGSRLALVAPRGSAKSTWVSLAYPLWAAVHRCEPYILLISDTQSQA